MQEHWSSGAFFHTFFLPTTKPILQEFITVEDNNRKQNALTETLKLSFKLQPTLMEGNAIKCIFSMGKLTHYFCASDLCRPQLHRGVLMILP